MKVEYGMPGIADDPSKKNRATEVAKSPTNTISEMRAPRGGPDSGPFGILGEFLSSNCIGNRGSFRIHYKINYQESRRRNFGKTVIYPVYVSTSRR